MSIEDRKKWDAKYSQRSTEPPQPSQLLTSLAAFIPTGGRALDLAGGNGRHAIWLAQRGMDVTLADVSDVGLGQASYWAQAASTSLTTVRIDLETEPIPPGPWDLVVLVLYIWRPLYEQLPHVLNRSGRVLCIHPTRVNLQRNEKPPEQFLLAEGELRRLLHPLRIIHYQEGWLDDGRHDAVAIAESV